jgi:thiamine biosynthesis protein ThiC
MKPLELMKRLGGEALANKLRAKVNGKIVILARLEGEEYVLTDTGFNIAAKLNAEISTKKEEPVAEETTGEEVPKKKTVTRTRKGLK